MKHSHPSHPGACETSYNAIPPHVRDSLGYREQRVFPSSGVGKVGRVGPSKNCGLALNTLRTRPHGGVDLMEDALAEVTSVRLSGGVALGDEARRPRRP